MARAKLHLICGNCGCNNMWEWDHKKGDEDAPEDVYLHCRNCATLHSLNDNAKNRNTQPAIVGYTDKDLLGSPNGTECPVCGEPQFKTPAGLVCNNGHGF